MVNVGEYTIYIIYTYNYIYPYIILYTIHGVFGMEFSCENHVEIGWESEDCNGFA